MLTPEEKDALISIARAAIEAGLAGKKPAVRELPGALSMSSGVFVTIRIRGELAGCVGFIDSDRSLGELAAEAAVKAAFEDPRFPPLTCTEYPDVTIDVSVLSKQRPLESLSDLEIGIHGLIVQRGAHRGLLLPHVAIEHGWDREHLLEAGFRKAGLAPSAADDPSVTLFVFTAEVVRSGGVHVE